MSCRVCKSKGYYLKNGRYLECRHCQIRASNVPKMLGMSKVPIETKEAVENSCFAVENSSKNQTRDLKINIIERLLFLHDDLGLSWRDIAKKIGCNHTSVMRWASGKDLANSHKILNKHIEKLGGIVA